MNWDSDRKILSGGDIGGDHQAGGSYSLRYHLASDRTRIVTVYTYPVEKSRGRFQVEIQIEYLVCTDPRYPGDTERWANAEYENPPSEFRSLKKASDYAATLIRGHRARDITWNGKAPRES